MSNLRDLLQTENQEELKKRVCGTESTQWGNGWGNVLVDGYDIFYAGHCWMQPQMTSYRAWCGGFCVYPGTTTVQFHIWGGGGSGGGACCCQQGRPIWCWCIRNEDTLCIRHGSGYTRWSLLSMVYWTSNRLYVYL